MLVVVNTVSSLVHLYSIGYMHDDPHRPRFFAYLSLFTFAMLMLVTSDNLVQMFFGWEGVGLASYLLIGFWFKKPSANAAAMKAFIVNRVGDFGFALGIFGCSCCSARSISSSPTRLPWFRGRGAWRGGLVGEAAAAWITMS
jgi:NADH-quinone oxidoreductase subunit L